VKAFPQAAARSADDDRTAVHCKSSAEDSGFRLLHASQLARVLRTATVPLMIDNSAPLERG
jgi:hypothetical protein